MWQDLCDEETDEGSILKKRSIGESSLSNLLADVFDIKGHERKQKKVYEDSWKEFVEMNNIK